MPSEFTIIYYGIAALVAANALALVLYILYRVLPNSNFRSAVREVIYRLDEFADIMENGEKRALAVYNINELLGWRRIFVPSVLIGWAIDAEVKAIRKMQEVTGTEDLHIKEQQFFDQAKLPDDRPKAGNH